jgi:hypothetical protein
MLETLVVLAAEEAEVMLLHLRLALVVVVRLDKVVLAEMALQIIQLKVAAEEAVQEQWDQMLLWLREVMAEQVQLTL